MGRGVGLGGKGEETKYKLAVIKRHGDKKYRTGNRVGNTVITMHGARWVLDLLE